MSCTDKNICKEQVQQRLNNSYFTTYDIIAFCNKYSKKFKSEYPKQNWRLDQLLGDPGKGVYTCNQITYVENTLYLFLSNFIIGQYDFIFKDYVDGKIDFKFPKDKKFKNRLIDILEMLLEMCKKSYREYTSQPCKGKCNEYLNNTHLYRDKLLANFITKIKNI